MKSGIYSSMVSAALLLTAATSWSADVQLPGDRGPMGRPGGAPRPANAGPPAPRPKEVVAPTPSMAVAMKAALAIAEACKQYPMALAVTDSQGVAKLIYVPDGSTPWHGYSAVRKAYTAVVFKEDSSKVIAKMKDDPAIMEKINSDPNIQPQSGGLVLMSGGQLIGAIGVSGAEPGGHDEECGLVGLEKIKGDLK